ncbi:MAG: SIMPL domain-containing protein [Nevskiales bacterium]
MKPLPTLVVLMALAQPAAADTLLRLSETAHVSVHPDELAASLRSEGTGATPTKAQAEVNAAIGRALDQANQVQGVVATTGFYQVWQATQPTSQWHAHQSIELKGHDGEAMLKLVGSLQGQGLALERLGWQVSREASGHARSEATRAALGGLRGRAEAAAAILGLRFVSFREVNLDASRPMPPPLIRSMAMPAAAAAMPTPHAETENVDIDATVDAEAVLVPAQP